MYSILTLLFIVIIYFHMWNGVQELCQVLSRATKKSTPTPPIAFKWIESQSQTPNCLYIFLKKCIDYPYLFLKWTLILQM